MANQVYTRLQKSFPLVEATYGVVPASHPVNADACLIQTIDGNVNWQEIVRPDKTGSFGEILGIPGRRSGTWRAMMSMAGNGAPGVKPDCDEYLQCAFNAAPVIVGGTSVTYSLSDNIPPISLSIFSFNPPSTATQLAILGALASKMQVSFGGDVPTLDFSGECMWVYDTVQAADSSTDTTAKGGLSSFPAEPSAPVTNGTPPPGFSGVITLDGNTFTTLRTGTIDFSPGGSLQKDGFSVYPVAPGKDTRSIPVTFDLYDDDSSILNTLKDVATTPTFPVETLTFQIGTVAGNKWTWTLRNVKLNAPTYDNGSNRRTVKFTGKAHDTTIGACDAMTLVIT